MGTFLYPLGSAAVVPGVTPQISMIRHTPPEAVLDDIVLDGIVDWRAQSSLIPKGLVQIDARIVTCLQELTLNSSN